MRFSILNVSMDRSGCPMDLDLCDVINAKVNGKRLLVSFSLTQNLLLMLNTVRFMDRLAYLNLHGMVIIYFYQVLRRGVYLNIAQSIHSPNCTRLFF